MKELTMEQGSPEWHKARWGVITGTKVKHLFGTKDAYNKLLYEVVAKQMTEVQSGGYISESMQRGLDLEPMALLQASQDLGINYEITGMLMSTEIVPFGMSPDGVDREGGKIVGGIEIKCPEITNHVRYIKEAKVPAIYKYQVLSPFVVSDDIKYWTFMSYDDRNYTRPAFYHTVMRDTVEEEVQKIRAKLVTTLEDIKKLHEEVAF